MTALGNEFAMLLLVAGNWHTLAKLEGELVKLTESSGMTISMRRTDQRPPRLDMVSYTVDVVCLDQPGVLHSLSGFFSSRGIDIGDISTRIYNAAHTGAPMFSVYMVVLVPTRVHIAALREEFMDLCDNLNLDAILEPLKA
jgi:glycine cleavage system transcriptional repressor